MRRIRYSIALASFLLLASMAQAADVTVYRDKYGVPGIVGKTLADAVYGLGYCTAQDNAERMALNYKQARGRLAEVEGKGQLIADGFLRALGIEEMAQKKAAEMSGEQSVLIKAYCDGANLALSEQKGKIPAWIQPFTPVDVLSLAQLVNAAFPLQDIASKLLPGVGSNQFAVSKKRSANGHAILSADPHLLWSGPLLWYEFALYTPEFNFRGITPSGLPFGSMGHTDHVAWSMTNNNPSLYTFYTVGTDPSDPRRYQYHGEWRMIEQSTVDLQYLDGGEMKTNRQQIRRTEWGPMVPFRQQAVKLSMLGHWEMLDQALNMARARNAREFRDALRPLGLSMWNIVYADTHGHIGYQFNARVPKRDESFDWTKPVSGADPKTRWGVPWPLDSLPHVENPRSGLLCNCNSDPHFTPVDEELASLHWPSYVTSYGHTTRYDLLSALLARDDKISTQEAKRYATDTEVPYARKTVEALGTIITGSGIAADLKEPWEVLSKWDGRSDVDSRGCGLYLHWFIAGKGMPALARKAAEGGEWTAEEAGTATVALVKAAGEMKQHFGRLDVPWGDVHRSTRGSVTVPVSGLGYAFGYGGRGDYTATVTPNFGTYKDGRITCTGGSSFRMIVDLDPKGVKSWSVLPYGESQNPASPHSTDQMALHGRGEYKETNFGLRQAEKSAVMKLVLKRE